MWSSAASYIFRCRSRSLGQSTAILVSVILILGSSLEDAFPSVVRVAAAATVHQTTYVGCYADALDIKMRGLPYRSAFNDKMTVEYCAGFCASYFFPVFGVEYGVECWCGWVVPSVKEKEEKCSMACGGNNGQKCGGNKVLSVHSVGNVPPKDTKRPLVGLTMIVKDEAHTIHTTLNSVKTFVDAYFILDTGSKDGTQGKIRELAKEHSMKLYLWEEPFKDYAYSRNRVMNLANATDDRPVFMLTLSADEHVTNPEHVREWLEKVRYASGSGHGAYPINLHYAGGIFDSVRIARVDDGWRYKGRVHEALTSPEGGWQNLFRPDPEIHVMFKATDVARRHEQQKFILKVLLEDTVEDPKNTRAWLFIASTANVLGNLTLSYYAYDQLAKVTSWDEERYHALFERGKVATQMKKPFPEVLGLMLEAHKSFPTRMPALHWISEHYFNAGEYELSYVFALPLADIPIPDNMFMITNLLSDSANLYEYEGNRLLGMAAARSKHPEDCVRALQKVIAVRQDDDIAKRELETCKKALDKKVQDKLEELAKKEEEKRVRANKAASHDESAEAKHKEADAEHQKLDKQEAIENARIRHELMTLKKALGKGKGKGEVRVSALYSSSSSSSLASVDVSAYGGGGPGSSSSPTAPVQQHEVSIRIQTLLLIVVFGYCFRRFYSEYIQGNEASKNESKNRRGFLLNMDSHYHREGGPGHHKKLSDYDYKWDGNRFDSPLPSMHTPKPNTRSLSFMSWLCSRFCVCRCRSRWCPKLWRRD